MANAITQALMGGAYTRNPLFAAPGQGAELFAKPYSTAGLFNVGNQIMAKPQPAAPALAPAPTNQLPMVVPYRQARTEAFDRIASMQKRYPGAQIHDRPSLIRSEGGYISPAAMEQRSLQHRRGVK